jgi:hypothetical protein
MHAARYSEPRVRRVGSRSEIAMSASSYLSISTRRLSRQRLLVADVVAAARRVPTFPVERLMSLGKVEQLRAGTATRIGWAAIFAKAYAIVARDMPMLRSWYVPGLRPRMATSSSSVATLSVNRRVDDEDQLYWAHLPCPDEQALVDLQAAIDQAVHDPIETIFRRQMELAMLPGWLRRWVLFWNLHAATAKRAKRMGTFSISTLSGLGAFNRQHPSPLTTSIAYGPLDASGQCLVTLLADHRLLDGAPVARVLAGLEEVLCGVIADELWTARRDASQTTAVTHAA